MMNNNNKTALKTRTMTTRTSNFAEIGRAYTTPEVPIGEVVANAIDALPKIGTEKREIAIRTFFNEGRMFLEIKNTGTLIPNWNWSRIMALGLNDSDEYRNENDNNHMHNMGLKIFLSYFSPHGIYSFETKVSATEYEAIFGPYKEDFKIDTYPIETWPYGDDFVTCITVEVENTGIDMSNVPDFLAKKFAWALMEDPDFVLTYNGDRIEPYLHAIPLKKKESILSSLYEEETSSFRKEVKVQQMGRFKKAVVNCPLINGQIEVVQMVADKYAGDGSTKGATIYNHGIRVEYSSLDIFASRTTIDKKRRGNKFKPLNGNRNEANRLATYVNLVPGPGVKLPFNNDKTGVEWTNANSIGPELSIFLDNLIGDAYREEFRKNGEIQNRQDIDAVLDYLTRDTNLVAIREAVFNYGGSPRYIDNLLLPYTRKNKKDVDEYETNRKRGEKCKYVLSEKDFAPKSIEPSEEAAREGNPYNFVIVEFKPLTSRTTNDENVDQGCRYARQLANRFGLEKNRIPIKLFGGKISSGTATYIQDLREEGFLITVGAIPSLLKD